MPGPRSAPNGQWSLTIRCGEDKKAVVTGKTKRQREKGKVSAAKNRPLKDD